MLYNRNHETAAGQSYFKSKLIKKEKTSGLWLSEVRPGDKGNWKKAVQRYKLSGTR